MCSEREKLTLNFKYCKAVSTLESGNATDLNDIWYNAVNLFCAVCKKLWIKLGFQRTSFLAIVVSLFLSPSESWGHHLSQSHPGWSFPQLWWHGQWHAPRRLWPPGYHGWFWHSSPWQSDTKGKNLKNVTACVCTQNSVRSNTLDINTARMRALPH